MAQLEAASGVGSDETTVSVTVRWQLAMAVASIAVLVEVARKVTAIIRSRGIF